MRTMLKGKASKKERKIMSCMSVVDTAVTLRV